MLLTLHSLSHSLTGLFGSDTNRGEENVPCISDVLDVCVFGRGE
jgi:hypothetical protein